MPASHLSFEKCTYTVQTTLDGKPKMAPCGASKTKPLLKSISADVRAGHVLAILGPSGAGKTTLLNMLTLEKKAGGTPTGLLKLNGKPFTLSLYKKHCAYVQQNDALWASLNAREHLSFAYALMQPGLSPTERAAEVEDLLKTLGLTEHATVKAGNQFMRGLSGGLKRRLSIGIALAKRPLIVYLDEPTTGVDSASAAMIMTFLKEIASKKQIAVLCTIHQPPASVFAGFDDNLVLASGRIAYFGPAKDMGDYFASIGKAPPPGVNMAEFVLDLVNKDFTSSSSVDAILDAWSSKEQNGGAPAAADDDAAIPEAPRRAGFLSQCITLTKRAMLVSVREPIQYTGRMVAILFSMAFFSLVYLSSRERVQDQVQVRCFYLMFCLGIPAQFMMVTVFSESFIANSIKREVKDGMYHPAAAAIASWIVQIPYMFLLSACACLPTFLMGDLYWPSFGMALCIHSCMFWAFEGMAQAQALEVSPLLGLMNFLNLFFMAFLFCGMFVRPQDVIWPFRLACYVMPLQWTMKAFVHAVFIDGPDYNGALPCNAGSLVPVPQDDGSTRYAYCLSYDGRAGYYCPDDPDGFLCFGQKGADIIDSLGVRFEIFDSGTSYAVCLGAILGFGAFFRLAYLGRLIGQCAAARVPKSPDLAGEIKMTTTPTSSKHAGAALSEPSSPAEVQVPIKESDEVAAPPSEEAKLAVAITDVTYHLSAKGGLFKRPAKNLISGISASLSSGEVLAIVGPSGSGKTTLLNSLTLEPGPGSAHGMVSINGHAVNKRNFNKYCVFVPREDTLWATLSARAHIALAFECYRPELDKKAREAAIDEMLAATGMESCQNTRAGDMIRPGLSGGQRRRLSLAMALVKQPKLIVLDEPTSGLDSAAAAAITKVLSNCAKRTNAAIICTIHQPSAAVLAGFERLFVLTEGRCAYCGPTSELNAHMQSLGFEVPSTCNPAEFVLDLVSKDIASVATVEKVIKGWEGKGGAAPAGSPVSLAAPPPKAGLLAQTATLTKRTITLAIKEPLLYVVRCVMAFFMICFFGLMYRETAANTQEQAPYRLFFLWWVLCVPVSLDLVTVFVLNIELKTIKTEIKNGMYSPLAYVISNTLIQVPFMFVLANCAILPAFAIGGWSFENYLTFMLCYAASMWAFECLAQLLSLIKNPLIGMLQFVMCWSSAILFCGLVFRGEDCIWPLRAFYYVLPLKWVFNSAAYDVYMPARYDDAEFCVPGSEPGCSSLGYICRNSTTSLQCFGATGSQVLDTLQYSYDTLSSKDDRALDIVLVLAFAVFMKVVYAIGFTMQVRANAPLKASSAPAVAAAPQMAMKEETATAAA